MADFTGLIASWVMLLVPPPCYDEFFKKYNFFDGPCLKIVISKALGFGIIVGAVLVKIPQILKILKAKSGEGISNLGVTLELVALTASFCYSYAQGYPFSSYGDSLFLMIQNLIINFLVLYFNDSTMSGIVYTGVFGAILSFLLSSSAPVSLLWALQASVIPVVATARLIQAYTNYSNRSTGQLSAITVFLLFAGSLARVFTSIQETGDTTIILTYVVTSSLNALIAFQMMYYWNAVQKKKD